ncbi:MAG: glycosyltransferase family 87 protein, partial [bacterium]|nr:glycosyltransferase family 87 protein [bacterium]
MKINKYVIVLTVGIILRLVLASVSYHSDVAALTYAGQVLTKGHILDFYDYLPNLPSNTEILKVFSTSLFNYPPLVYFLVSAPAVILTFFINSAFQQTFIYNIAHTFGDPNLFLELLLFKLPYLVYDIFIALLIMKVFQSSRERFLGLSLWMFNPINLYATYMMGQFDIIPTFFVVLSLFLIYSRKIDDDKRLLLASLMLGIGAAVKIFPLFFLVPVASLSKSWRGKIQIFI